MGIMADGDAIAGKVRDDYGNGTRKKGRRKTYDQPGYRWI